MLLVCLNASEAVRQSRRCEAEQGRAELPAARCAVCQSPASHSSTTAQQKFKGVMGKKPAITIALSEHKQNQLFFDNSKIIPLRQIIFMSVDATTALRHGRRPVNDPLGGPCYCRAGKLPAAPKTDTSPSTVPMPTGEPDSTRQPCGGTHAAPRGVRVPTGTQDCGGSRHILCSHENGLSNQPPCAGSHIAQQAHKGTGRHALAAIATILSTRRISHLITAMRRRLFHPELQFYPPHSKSLLVHILLMAGSSLSTYQYRCTYTCMTIKHFFNNVEKLHETDSAQTPQHRNIERAWAAQTQEVAPLSRETFQVTPDACSLLSPEYKCPHGIAPQKVP